MSTDDQNRESPDGGTMNRTTAIKLVLACVLCLAVVAGLVLFVQYLFGP